MKLELLGLGDEEKLIEGVKLIRTKFNRDERGFLVETLKTSWSEVFNDNLPFSQSYFSMTKPGCARDENLWHVHPTIQIDRFVVVKGTIVIALYDLRENSKTYRQLDLVQMGEKNKEDNQFLLLISPNILHGFCVVGNKPAYLINSPTTLYDPQEEGRIPFAKVEARFADGTPFSWKVIREYIK